MLLPKFRHYDINLYENKHIYIYIYYTMLAWHILYSTGITSPSKHQQSDINMPVRSTAANE